MKVFKVLSFLTLAAVAVIFVVQPFNGKVSGLPNMGGPYDPYFEAANDWFDSVAAIRDQDLPTLEKIEAKLHYIGLGLGWEKDGKWVAFDTLEKKLDNILGQPGAGLPSEVISDFYNANFYFDSVGYAHLWKGELPLTVQQNFFYSNANFDTVRLIHDDILFPDSSELWRIERKLWNLNQALKNEKHAKKGAFEDLEAKLDTLLGEPYVSPEEIGAYFDTADSYFDSVDFVHKQVGGLTGEVDIWFEIANEWFDSVNYIHEFPPSPIEWENIEWKIYYLNLGLWSQKEGKHFAFWELEAKLDTLLGWEFIGLPPDVEDFFLFANIRFDSVRQVHEEWQAPELEKIEWKIDYLKKALEWQKMAKHRMFWELEFKLDSLLHQPFKGLPEEVDSFFSWANAYFDSINMIHQGLIFEQEPEDWKIMQKLHYLKYGLKYQKEAMWIMFMELEFKLDMLAEPRSELPGLPQQIDSLFASSNEWFDSVNSVYGQVDSSITWRVEWMLHYLKHALKDEKDAKWKAFDELKRKAYEFDKMELKLYYLGKALQYQKDAKRLMFTDLENKLDLLLGMEPQGLPQEVMVDFDQANYFFGLVDSTHHNDTIPEISKIEEKLLFLRDALIYQKHAVWKMFDTLSVKIDSFAQLPRQDLDPGIVTDFLDADAYFADSINLIEQIPGLTELQKIELKIYYLSQGMQFVKNAMEMMFTQWKEKLFEFDKVEKKLFYIGKGAKYQKEAKEGAFVHLEEKLDTLFEWREWDPLKADSLIFVYFDSANAHFDQVSFTHEDITIRELAKIMMKINLLQRGFKYQKDATWIMFLNLEEKLDSLLGKDFPGTLPDTVSICFDSANHYFDLSIFLYDDPVPVGLELDKIESMLDLFTKGLKFAKDAKWMMFDTLEVKIDSLIETDVREIGEKETRPERFTLLQNYPNPFNPTTNIEFVIPEPARVKVEIYNILGERIITLVEEKLSAGYKIVEWDGKDDQGRKVSTGIYFYRLKAGDFTQTRKMLLLK